MAKNEREQLKIALTQTYYDVVSAGLKLAMYERTKALLGKSPFNYPQPLCHAMAKKVADDVEKMALNRTVNEISDLLDRAL